MTLDEAVDEIYLGEEKFYLIIDIGITELRRQETIAITRVSGHKPGSFDQTWNDPPGNGPFKVIIPAKIQVKENISGSSPVSSPSKNMLTKEYIRQVIEEVQKTPPRTEPEHQYKSLNRFFVEILDQNEDLLYELFWDDFNAWIALFQEEKWGADRIFHHVFTGIAQVYTPRALELVCKLLLHPEFPQRDLAAEILGAWEQPEAIPSLAVAIQDEDYEVKSRAVYALGKIGGPEAEALLISLIDREFDYDENEFEAEIVRGYALSGLFSLESETASEKIVQIAMHDYDNQLRCDAIVLMKSHMGEAALPYLYTLANDSVEEVAETARWYINDISGEQEIQTLSSILSTNQPNEEIEFVPVVSQPEDVFTSITYKKIFDNYWQLSQKLTLLDARIQQKYKTAQEKLHSPEREQARALNEQLHQLHQSYWYRLPNHIVAHCPYCDTQILQPVDHFSLMGFYPLINIPDFYHGAYHISKTWADPEPPRQSCRHALLTTLSVNLNGLKPNDLPRWSLNRKWLYMSSSPRVMVWPLLARRTSAVIHSLPIGRLDDPEPMHRYTAYFITYFMDDISNLMTKEMWVPTDLGAPATEGVYYDPDLRKWVEAGRLYWLDPDEPSRLIKGPVSEFPYADIQPQGRYRIVEAGEVEGPYRYNPSFTWQGKAPHHNESFPQTIE